MSRTILPRGRPVIVSQARIDANRRNALKSTGPRTPEGKARSRSNALKHGLCASVVVPEDAELVRARSEEFFNTLRPQNSFHCWLVTEVALVSIRIDRAERIERRARDKGAIRAELFWDDDRKLEASLLGEQLANRPEVVVDQLGRTFHGCEWLMSRWAMLAHVADLKGAWTPSQKSMAFDLLGTPVEFREGVEPGASLDFEGRVIAGSHDPAAVARREIAVLKGRRELLEGLDEANRALAEADLVDDADPEIRRLRRYESALHGRLRWCLSQLRFQSPHAAPRTGLHKAWLGFQDPPEGATGPLAEAPAIPTAAAIPAPIPTPDPAPEVDRNRLFPGEHPPFDITVDELPGPGEELDIAGILAARRANQIRKAESRRDARRRKVEKLRA